MSEHLGLKLRDVVFSSSASYSILQLLGFGGSAETYLVLATQGSLRGQLFALKVFRRLSRPEWRRKFLDEVMFLQTCAHPAVMRVFDEGLYHDEHPFVVAEYLPSTLDSARGTSSSMMEKLGFAIQLLSALAYLARPEVAVVHRDIKPANVFIKGRSCVLGDFGLMKRQTSDREFDHEMLQASVGPRMPRNYRTPDLVEYYRGGPEPTDKSDIYQLGLVLAELFSGHNPQEPMKSNDFAEPIALRKFYIEGGLGKPLKNLIEPMLADDPKRRETAATLIDPWQELYLDAAQRSYALEGRVY